MSAKQLQTSSNRPLASRLLRLFLSLVVPISLPGMAFGYACSDVVVKPAQSTARVSGPGVQFTATALGQPVTGGYWNIAISFAFGGVDQSGMYTPPTSLPSPASAAIYYNLPGCAPYAIIPLLNPVPTIAWPEPSQVIQMSTFITLHGSGFVPGSTLTVNGQPVAISYLDGSRIQFMLNMATPKNGAIKAVVTSPSPGSLTTSTTIQGVFPTFTSVTPTTLVGGMNTITLNGTGITDSATFTYDGKPLYPTKVTQSTYTASVYVAPWRTGTIPVTVNPMAGSPVSSTAQLSIKALKVPFETAARFTTQAAFGPRIDIVQHIQSVGLQAFVQEQLAAPAVTYTVPGPMGGKAQFLYAATHGNTLLRMRVALALQSFIVNQASNYDFGSYIPWERKVEADALGNFRQLLTDTAQDARMGMFLNLAGNNAPTLATQHPNQNFAREVMQLFSMGPSMLNDDGSMKLDGAGKPIPAYDQNTLLDMARALTGWQYAPVVDGNYYFDGVDYSQNLVGNDSRHDHGAKTLFGTVNLPAGQSITADRTQALDAIFNQPSVPPFVSRQLIQHLVKSNPSPAYISRISKVFEDNGKGVRGDLSAVVSAILLDSEARAGDTNPESATDGFLQDPLMCFLFTVSTLGQDIADNQPAFTPGVMGEPFWYPPSVNGFYANTHLVPGTSTVSPEFTLWNNLSLTNRSQVLWGIITGSITGFGNDYMRRVWLYQDFTDPSDEVDAMDHLLYYGRMPAAMKTQMLSAVAAWNTTDRGLQFATVIFLAMNSDTNNVEH